MDITIYTTNFIRNATGPLIVDWRNEDPQGDCIIVMDDEYKEYGWSAYTDGDHEHTEYPSEFYVIDPKTGTIYESSPRTPYHTRPIRPGGEERAEMILNYILNVGGVLE